MKNLKKQINAILFVIVFITISSINCLGQTVGDLSNYRVVTSFEEGMIVSKSYHDVYGLFCSYKGIPGPNNLSSYDCWKTVFDNTQIPFIVKTDGKVGIGTTTPGYKLDVNGEINATGFKLNGVPFTGSGSSQWTTSDTNISYSTGNVGLGNTNPTVKLEIGADDSNTQTEYLKVHGGASFNNDTNETDLTQVSINTNVKVVGTALTVGGPTFIGSWEESDNTNSPTSSSLYLGAYNKANLFVTKGIISEAFILLPNEEWQDVVFSDAYNLATLSEVEHFIKQNKHLPGIISEKEVKTKGYDMHDMNQAFLEKIENLYLYSINQEKEIKVLKEQVNQLDELKTTLKTLQEKLEKIEHQKQ